MAGRVITIDIAGAAVKLLEAEDGKVTRWASLLLEPNMVEAGSVTAPQALGNALRQLMTSSGIGRTKNVVASISGLYAVSRLLSVPRVAPGSTLPETVRKTVEEAISLKVEELYLSWENIPSDDGQRALVLGVPREVIDTGVHALRAANLNPRVLDFKPVALARAVNKAEAIILNIESASFDIVILANAVPEAIRTVSWTPENISLEDRVEQLGLDVGLLVSFYNSRHPDLPLAPDTPLIITGEMSDDPLLIERMEYRIGFPIEPWEPPVECPEHFPVAQYAVNIGLSLRGMGASKNSADGGYLLGGINLLPSVYQPWKPSRRQILIFLATIVLVGLLVPAYQFTGDSVSKTAVLKDRLAVLNRQIERRQAEINSRQPLQRAVNEYETIVNLGGGLTEDLRVVRSLAEKLGVELGPVNHGGSKITFTATTDNYTTFREYLEALEESGRFSNPIPPPEGFPYTKSGPIELQPKAGK